MQEVAAISYLDVLYRMLSPSWTDLEEMSQLEANWNKVEKYVSSLLLSDAYGALPYLMRVTTNKSERSDNISRISGSVLGNGPS